MISSKEHIILYKVMQFLFDKICRSMSQ